MKKLIYLIVYITFLSSRSFAFTLNTGDAFNSKEVEVEVANDDCSPGGFSTEEYVGLIEDAVEKYWNSVPTAKLKLKVKGVNSSVSLDGHTFVTAINQVEKNKILAGCNDDAESFDGSSTSSGYSSTLGAAVMDCSDGCRSVLILNIHSTSLIGSLDRGELEATIAHELGHAIGLGHSEYEYNLMYYAIGGKFQKWLGQDDVDGVTYLYPHEAEDPLGAVGSCATIDLDPPNNDGPHAFILSIIFGMIFAMLAKWGQQNSKRLVQKKLRNPYTNKT